MQSARAGRFRSFWFAFLLATSVSFIATQVLDVQVADAKRKKKRKKRKKRKKAAAKKAGTCQVDKDCGKGKQCKAAKCVAAEKKPEEDLRSTGPAKLHIPRVDKDFDHSAKADKKRDEVIKDIKKILPTMRGPQKAELIFRLAEMYWEKSKFIESIEWAAFEKDVQDWVDRGMKGKEPKPEKYHRKSLVYKKQALANYRTILEKYKEYPRRDEVLYIMAYNEYEAGKKKEAVQNYWELIKQYPQSQYVGDAYLAMGEHYFNANKVLKARKAFLKALETKKPKVYSFALYKLAWCDYNLQEFDAAINKFKKVVEYAERQKSKGKNARDNVQLKSEALNDITLTFSHVDAVDEAYTYIRKKGGEKLARSLTEKLARIYKDQGKFDQVILTYRLLLNTYADDSACPDFQSSIVAAYSKLGKRKEVRVEVRRLVELYREGSPWWKKNESNKPALVRARDTAETRMRELVTDYHQYCQKFKKRDDCNLSKDIYAEYLKAFDDTEYAYRMRFFYAEILWDLGFYKEAGDQYDKVVERNPKGEYSRTAAFNSVLTWEKIVAGIDRDVNKKLEGIDEKKQKKRDPGRKTKITLEKNYKEAAKKGKTFEPKEIPVKELRLAAACDRYVSIVPVKEAKKDKDILEELVAVKFKAGAIYQKYYHFKEAAKRFGELIDRWPGHKLARSGADLILDSFDARTNWHELNKWSRKFQKNKSLMADKKFAQQINKYVEGSSFKEIMVAYGEANKLLKAKQEDKAQPLFAKSATDFLAFQREFKTSKFAPTALFNATVIYDRAKELDRAINAAELLLEKYDKELDKPANAKNKIKSRTILYVASFYERIADFAKAASYYERFVDKYKKDKGAADALYNAGILYHGLGDEKKAIATFGRYIKDYKTADDVPLVFWKIARIYSDQSDWRRAGALFSEFEKRFPKASPALRFESRYRLAESLFNDGRRKDALKTCGEITARFAKLPDALKKVPVIQEGAARCAFEGLDAEFEAFDAIKLKLPMKVMKKSLEAKLTQAPVLAQKYTTLINYGNGEWGVAGLVRGAFCFKSLVDALFEAPDPPKLSMDQLDIYRAELENEAFKYEDQAINGLELALKKGFELGIYSDWLMQGEEAYKKYRPNQFPDVKEMPFYASESFRSAASDK